MKWTQRQAQAIEERNVNLLVSAAAGSGKTAVLVERVKRLVLEDRVGLERMLIVTFTKAAASEMKEKIQKSLYLELAACEKQKEKQAYLRQQLQVIGSANISTFHAFALEVVHRYYHIIGKPPKLSICDEIKQKSLKDEAMAHLLENLFEAEDPEFRSFLDCYCTSKDNRMFEEMILDFHKFMKSIPNCDQWFGDALGMLSAEESDLEKTPLMLYLGERIKDSLDVACAYFLRAAKALEGCEDEKGNLLLGRLSDKIREDIAAVESIKDVAQAGRVQEALSAVNEGLKFSVLRANKAEAAYYEGALKDTVTNFRNEGKSSFKKVLKWCAHGTNQNIVQEMEMIREIAKVFYRFVKEFDRLYAEKKEKLRVLDFADIEHFALQILEDPSVCDEYKEHFDYIFIDEYQDSNKVQESLIQRISRDDNLFMVGDVKQSIYKFRLAEPELFIQKYFDYKSGMFANSKIVDLNSNFRSKEGLVDFVNALFRVIMNKRATGLDYDEDAALVKGSPYSGACDFRPLLYLVDASLENDEGAEEELQAYDVGDAFADAADLEIQQLKRVELEALQAVAIIKENMGKLVHDDKTDVDRRLTYKDMVILLRAVRSEGELFYKALSDADIPVFLDRNEGYFDTLEIKVFLNLLRLINNRKQDIPLISVLHSPIFGFSADELAEIRIFSRKEHAGRISYYDAFQFYLKCGDREALRSKCSTFWDKLNAWRLRVAHVPLGDFIWDLIVDTGYRDFIGAIAGGEQRKANLLALVDKATSYEASNFKGLGGFINYMEILSDKKGRVDIGQAKILSEGADVVRIMTIHKSKGLEFPFVLLGGMCKKINTHHNRLPIAYDKDMGFGFKLVNPQTGFYLDTLALKLINDKKQQEDLAESIRILYVALTRAKDRLVMLGSSKDTQRALEKAKSLIPGDVQSAGSFFDMVLAALGDSLCLKVIEKSELVLAQEQGLKEKFEFIEALEKGFKIDAAHLPISSEDILKRFTFQYPQEESDNVKRKYTVSQLAALEVLQRSALTKTLATEEDQEYELESDAYAKDFDFGIPRFLQTQTTLSGAEKGTAYHTVMEHIVFTSQAKDERAVAIFMEALVQANILTSQEAALVDPSEIASFFASETGERVLASSEVFKEAPFVLKTTYEEKEVMIQGTLDCYFQEGDSLVIVDYKSNYIDIAHKDEEMQRMRKTYLPQMRLYKEALETVTGKKVKECIIYLFGVRDQISLT